MKGEKIYAINTCGNLNTAQSVPILIKHKTVNLGILYHTNSIGGKY